jgi:hypothetical protein
MLAELNKRWGGMAAGISGVCLGRRYADAKAIQVDLEPKPEGKE